MCQCSLRQGSTADPRPKHTKDIIATRHHSHLSSKPRFATLVPHLRVPCQWSHIAGKLRDRNCSNSNGIKRNLNIHSGKATHLPSHLNTSTIINRDTLSPIRHRLDNLTRQDLASISSNKDIHQVVSQCIRRKEGIQPRQASSNIEAVLLLRYKVNMTPTPHQGLDRDRVKAKDLDRASKAAEVIARGSLSAPY